MSEDRACLSRAEVNLSLLSLLATFYHAGPTMNRSDPWLPRGEHGTGF